MCITYDAIGNPLTYDGWTFDWEHGRQLKSLDGNGYNIDYKYNASGIRTEKTVNGVTTKYQLEGDKVTFESNGTDSIHYSYDSNGKLVSMNLNRTEYYYIRNAQGDITGLFDNNGTTVVEYTYDSWGKLISTTGSLASTVGAKNPYRYRGYRYDSETQLYYLQSRYYNPEWGRFINADATLGNMGELLGNNMFAYSNNNPVNLSDPEGEFAFLATMAICGVVGAVVSAVTTAGMQYYTTGKINTTDVLVAAGVGFVAGALTPVVGASTWGMVGLGAGASVAQTVITNKVNGKSTSGKDIVKSAIIGGAAGAIGGKFTNLKGGYKPQTHYGGSIRMIPKDNIIVQMEAEEILNKATLNAYQNAVTVRSFVSGFFSNGGADQIIDAATNRIKIFIQPMPVGDFYYKI